MFADRLTALSQSQDRCRIFTPFGVATGKVAFCDGEEMHFAPENGTFYRLYCVDILGLEELSTVLPNM